MQPCTTSLVICEELFDYLPCFNFSFQQEADEPVLELLQDITVTFSESAPMGFTLHFHFKENEYFTNTILTKEYEMKCEPMVS